MVTMTSSDEDVVPSYQQYIIRAYFQILVDAVPRKNLSSQSFEKMIYDF